MPGPAGSAVVRRRLVVAGRVQGVWFRESCRQAAVELGVCGWVRNRTDGRVEVALEGPRAAVTAMVAWCHRGPPHAVVERVDEVVEEPVGERAFRVR